MIIPSSWRRCTVSLLAAVCLLVAATPGCTYFRSLGSGAHLDAERPPPRVTDTRQRVVQVEVTTDAQGSVATVTIKRSSGKEGIDGFVAESVRQGWPQQPSMRTLAEVTYSGDKGFSTPKVLSAAPVR